MHVACNEVVVPSCMVHEHNSGTRAFRLFSRVVDIVDKGMNDWKRETILSEAGGNKDKAKVTGRERNGGMSRMAGSPCCRGKEGEAQDEISGY